MDNLYIPPTHETPEIRFLFDEHTLYINGESYPENAMAFYAPIRASLQNYLDNAPKETEIEAHFNLRYFNSSSTKLIRSMIALMHETASSGKKISASWYHDPEDDMMQEFGLDLKEEFTLLNFRVLSLETA